MIKLPISKAFMIKTAKIGAISLSIIAVTGFFIIPSLLRSVIEKKMSEALHRTVSVRKVYFNPFMLSFALKGVTINHKDSSDVMVSFDEFYVNAQLQSVIKRGLIVSRVRLVKPYLSVTRNEDLTYSFSDLIQKEKTPVKDEKPKEPFKFSINNIEVINGSVDIYDIPKKTRHTVRDMHISVPFLSNLPYYLSSYVQPSFEAKINDTALTLKGKTLPFAESMETTLDIDLKNINLPYYLAYSPVPLKFKLLSGGLDVQTTVTFKQFKQRSPVVSVKGIVALNNIRVADINKRTLVELAGLSISFLPSDLLSKTVHLSEINIRAPKIYAERDSDGTIDLIKTFVPEKPRPELKQDDSPKKAAPLPIVDIDVFVMNDGMVLFTDWQPAAVPEGGEEEAPRPVKLLVDKITVKGSTISTKKDVKGMIEASMNINKKGAIQTSGSAGLNPLDVSTSVNISNIELSPFQPYIAQKANIVLNDGRFFSKGTAAVKAAEEKGISASYRGSVSISRFSVRDAVKGDDLLTWKYLQFDKIDAGFNPLYVKIKEIALSDFYARIIVDEDGAINLQKIAKKSPVAAAKSGDEKKQDTPSPAPEPVLPEPATPPDITIGQITLQAGTVNFTDNHIKPKFTANLLEIGGRVSGLSSKENIMADIDLRGLFDKYAPLMITGKINPLRKDLFVDVKADFKDMELSPLTPYSGKHIGRAIEKGKLSFSLQYNIVKKKLEARNDVFIDQLTLGEKIDSPTATKLPVGLAISLLKDRKGEIRLDIPVSGEIDSPEFSVWKIVLQVLVNLLTKAATSPFALLGSVMGGEELGYVEFDHGSSVVTEQNAKKIDILVKALYDRPALKLEITGYVDPKNDSEAMRADIMQKKLIAQKIKSMPQKDDQPVLPGSVQISAEEYPVYLKKAYKNEKFPKPRNAIGITKDLPDAEMEKLILAHIQITEDDLRQLASARARNIKDIILKAQKVEQERVFLLEPKSLTPEKKEKLKNSRVEFSLK